MRAFLTALLLLTAGPMHAQSACFMDSKDPAHRERIAGALERLVIAHLPIEFRNSCGLRDESDAKLWAAIRKGVKCEGSANYQEYFGPFLEDTELYLMAAGPTDLRTDEDYATYCEIVKRIDLNAAVKEDGTVNAEGLRAQSPLFAALNELMDARRWQN